MRSFTRVPSADPLIASINTTPLIDVMLVLLIMMLITLPSATHKIAIELPQAGAATGVPPVVHELAITANGSYAWDGVPLAEGALAARLAAFAADRARPVLSLRTDPALAYDRFDRTLAAVKRAGITRLGFADNPPRF